jgi:prepilin-type N-terminal cleavage/methylation domain-containing protein
MKIVPFFSGWAGGALSVRVGGRVSVRDHVSSAIGSVPWFACGMQSIFHRVGQRRVAAFTLIELLVVISIIAILAGVAFPAVNGALNSARKAQARNDVQQIAAAIKAFQSEYGRFPTTDINTNPDNDYYDGYYSSNKNIIAALLAMNDSLNPKKIVFLEAKPSAKGKGGLSTTGEFVDPWGKSYIIKMDTNYNGKTEYHGNRFTSVIVLSPGPDGDTGPPDSGTGKGKDDICSFK